LLEVLRAAVEEADVADVVLVDVPMFFGLLDLSSF
jgi:hypothetical protein